MSATHISALNTTGSGRPVELARAVILAVTFPIRLVHHYSSPTPASRPMAAALVPSQSREDHPSTRAGYDALSPAVVPGQVV